VNRNEAPEAAEAAAGPRIAILVRKLSGRGGMETVIRTVARAAGDAVPAVPVEVWCFGVPVRREWLDGLPHRVANIDQGTGRRFQLGAKLWWYTRQIRRFQASFGATALLATDPVFVRASLAACGPRPHRPVVLSWLHFPLDRMANTPWIRAADGHLALGSQLAEQIRALDPRRPPTVVGNPLPDDSPPPVPAPSIADPRILYVGRLANRQKRVDLLLQALALLKDRRWTLTLAGDGPDGEALRAEGERLGLSDRVAWIGWQADPWAAAGPTTVLVLPSDFEGFPMVLLEALARGMPVVATDSLAGPRDIVRPGENGWLTPVGDLEALAAAIARFLPPDPDPLTLSPAERIRDVQDRFGRAAVWRRIAGAISVDPLPPSPPRAARRA
jgi:UDP-D-galactose:(glucosyl)LPS alpha-1,6-D-galactosyltransferase